MARAGVCVSGHPEVTKSAAEVLAAGGNAFDGAVAAGFASAVCEPALTSLGGGGFLGLGLAGCDGEQEAGEARDVVDGHPLHGDSSS